VGGTKKPACKGSEESSLQRQRWLNLYCPMDGWGNAVGAHVFASV
jgi:hypothetical protein